MAGLPSPVPVCYCSYWDSATEDGDYMKKTHIWSNSEYFVPRRLCANDCEFIEPGTKRHIGVAQRGPVRSKKDGKLRGNPHTQAQLFSIPQALCRDIELASRAAVPGGHVALLADSR